MKQIGKIFLLAGILGAAGFSCKTTESSVGSHVANPEDINNEASLGSHVAAPEVTHDEMSLSPNGSYAICGVAFADKLSLEDIKGMVMDSKPKCIAASNNASFMLR